MHACVNVRFPSPLAWRHRHAWPCTRITPGDRMGTHTHAHIAGARETRCRADGCWGGHGGYNRRMWCIVLTHVAMQQGLPEVNVMVWHMWWGRWLTVVRAEPVHVEIDPNCELELFTVVDIMGCYQWHNKVRKGMGKVMKMINIEQVLPKYFSPRYFFANF